MLQLEHPSFGTSLIEIVEDSIETNHATLTNLAVILDVQQREATGIFIEIVHRTLLSTYCPIYIHLEEEIVGVGMFYHIVLHYLALYLLELMAVIVITQLHASGSNLLTYLIVEIADGLEVSQGITI